MDVKEAALMAKDYLANVFAEEEITHIGLEEVDFDQESKTWKVTVGFFRPWDQPGNAFETSLGGLPVQGRRSFKVVRIKDRDGHIQSITDRVLGDPA